MKIELPQGHSSKGKNEKSKNSHKKKSKPKKIAPENIYWRDNGDTISAKIGKQVIYINKKTFNIELNNGFIIKCKSLEDSKNKAILLFNK